jgi:hypothetical protein
MAAQRGCKRAACHRSVRRLAHELRNYIAPIVNAVHLIRLRGNRDQELSALAGIIDRQLAAIIQVLDVAVDADQAAICAPAVTLPVQAIESDAAGDRLRGDATFANRRKLIVSGTSNDLVRGGPSSGTRVTVPAGEVATPSGERQAGRD